MNNIRKAIILVFLFVSPTLYAGDTPAQLTEDYLFGGWEGKTDGNKKMAANFEKEGNAVFSYFNNEKVTHWKMRYTINSTGEEISYEGRLPNGNTWDGKLKVPAENELAGDYVFFSSKESKTYPSRLTLKRTGK